MQEREGVNGITVHKTVPSGDGRSAGGFHSPPDNDQFLRGGRGMYALALLDDFGVGSTDSPGYRSWLPKPGEIRNS